MSTRILGISAYYHDSAAALLVDGDIVAAAQEERFTRKKHDHNFPKNAVHYCLRQAGIEPEDLDYVVFYEKPFLKFERLMETYLAFAPQGLGSFLAAMPLWLKTKLHLPGEIRKSLDGRFDRRIVFTGHHESHAASAFYPSPFDEAAILTMDGVGEWDTASIGMGRGNKIELLKTLEFPNSAGLLYSAFTYFTGFRVNSGEYKLMGLAPYGEPKYVDLILDKLVDLKDDGSLAMDMRYFNYCQGLTMTNDAFARLFGGPPRDSESLITQREMDMAASIQKVTEEIVLRMARTAKKMTGAKYLCLAGGVALNCVANGVLLREKIFDDIWIPPPAGDAGVALGGALFVYYRLLGAGRVAQRGDAMHGSLLGPGYSNGEIRAFLDSRAIKYTYFEQEPDLLAATVEAMTAGKVVGWFQDRMEFGPRALGARSIIGDARSEEMQSRMNLRIKFRESFRPFAPSVLKEDAQEWFDLEEDSPYMLLVAPVAKEHRRAITVKEQSLFGIDKLNLVRSSIPAVTHLDYSARVQTVATDGHPRFRALLEAFKARTDCGMLVNTSFNVRGEPIVCTPEDAFRCFMGSGIDILAIGDCFLVKDDQEPSLACSTLQAFDAD